MGFTIKKSWSDPLVFGLSVFLIFCLIFETYIELPALVEWLGNWHPLMLHFPIVLLVLAVYVSLVQKKISHNLLTLATLTALITAITGFFLSLGSSHKGAILFWHQWLGAGLALLTALWYWLEGQKLGQLKFTKTLQVSIVIGTLLAGHFGGMITHGENFLALPGSNTLKKIPKDPIIYEHLVARIVDQKCASCHNANKQKGEYTMTAFKDLLKGGKTGKAVDLDHPEESELLKRLHLPREDEKHMPPSEKKQLSSTEIQLIEEWIRLGASDTLRLQHIKSDSPLVALVNTFIKPDEKISWNKLPKIDTDIINNLTSDYLTIKRLASGTDALSINMYTPPQYSSELITKLAPVAKNIIQLDFSGLPLKEKELAFIGSCSNLEKLEIDKTPINDSTVTHLKTLKKLKVLKIFNTAITDSSIEVFEQLQSLEKLFINGTQITNKGVTKLQKTNPSLKITQHINEEIVSFFVKDSLRQLAKDEENK